MRPRKVVVIALVLVICLTFIVGFSYRESIAKAIGHATAEVKVSVAGAVISGETPTNSSTLATGTTSTLLGVDTDVIAECRYSNSSGAVFASMTSFNNTNSTTHNSTITISGGTTYDYYIKCNDTSGNINAAGYHITFSVASSETAATPGGGGRNKVIIKKDGKSLEVFVGNKVELNIKGKTHTIIIKNVGKDYVTLTIQSEPITVTVTVDEPKLVDIDRDSKNDVKIDLVPVRADTLEIVFTEVDEKPTGFIANIVPTIKRTAHYIYFAIKERWRIALVVLVIFATLITWYSLRIRDTFKRLKKIGKRK